ncbi:MAG: T9SS type A sorting domain-containing protein [Bacteroidetes bacterium]|nr:T9SS type A sorting domain-containing protein [Bacteroidota bacterium]
MVIRKFYRHIMVLIYFLLLIAGKSKAQDLFVHYPVSATIAFNGGQQRLECSVYDSLFQTNVTYNTNWSTDIIIITGNHDGILTYTFWTSPGVQAPKMEFLIYDYILHEFSVQKIIPVLTATKQENIVSGTMWVRRRYESYSPASMTYNYNSQYYRYNLYYHKWISLWDEDSQDVSSQQDIYAPWMAGSQEYFLYTDYDNYFEYYFYDPVADTVNNTWSGCPFWVNISDDYVVVDAGCFSDYSISVYDALLHQRRYFPIDYVVGSMDKGIFFAWEESVQFPLYGFTYDQELNSWMIDTILNADITNYFIEDRVLAYLSDPANGPLKVFYQVYNQQLKEWVKDSAQVVGNISGLVINDGEVSWTDANGLNVRGYDSVLGWVNSSTPVFLDFQITDFTSSGFPGIHVRNYSVGRTDLFYDFGDGVRTDGQRLVTWHMYKNPGTYNVCIYTSDSLFSSCQQVTINNCVSGGFITTTNDTICSGDSITLSVIWNTGNMQWQRKFGTVWVDETGPGANDSVYTFTPMQTSIYRLMASDSGCMTSFSNQINIVVYPKLVGIVLQDTLVNICAGQSAILKVLNPPTASYKWQQSSGSGWTNATGINNQPQITVTPTSFMHYRVVITSGVCESDTLYADVNIITLPGTPVATGATICGPGVVNLSATGTGNIEWYQAAATNDLLATGNTYSPFVNATTDYVALATTGGMGFGGHPDIGIGTAATLQTGKFGHRFFVDVPARLVSFAIYPQTSGTLGVALKIAGTTTNVATQSFSVVGGSGKTTIPVNFVLESGVLYDLVITGPTYTFDINTSGFAYPFSTLNNSLYILGYINGLTYDTLPVYYGIYDWKLATGCYSNAATAQALVGTPFTATLTASGPLTFCQGQSVTLNAQPTGAGYSYNWLNNNSLIPGANSSSFNAVATGSYKAIAENSGCKDTTGFIRVTVPCISPIEAGEKTDIETTGQQSMNAFYNGQSNELVVNINSLTENNVSYSIIDYSGRTINSGNVHVKEGLNTIQLPASHFAQGIYMLRMFDGGNTESVKFLKY